MTDDRDPRLIWTEAGEPRSDRFGDVYFSTEGGLAESRAVFLTGCGLPEAWTDRRHFTVAELGFGTGLNIAALLHLWRDTRPPGARLSIFSVEAFPMSEADARRALARFPDVAEASEALLAAWPAATPGFHRLDLPGFDAVLDLAIGEAETVLDRWSGPADAWFLDGFAPSTNPGMWSEAVFDAIAERSAPGARVATFTVAGAVRRGLAERGFVVDKRPGHGRKRERLEAVLPSEPAVQRRIPTVAVVGAGIAGAAVVRALMKAQVTPLLFEAEGPGAGASGFPSALVTPRFDLGDATIAALFAQALDRANTLYAAIPDAVVGRGVLQMPGTARDTDRFPKLAAQLIWPAGTMALTETGDLAMHQALTVSPRRILLALLSEMKPASGLVVALSATDSGWALLDDKDAILAEVDAVVVCAGPATSALVPTLDLAQVRGQAEWTTFGHAPATAWGGYVAPMLEGFLFGATHDRGDLGTDVRPADTTRNLGTLVARLPDLAAGMDVATLHSRAAVRATTRDRLPVCGAVADAPGLFVLGGLGSRGFCLAPLLAEHVAALILRRPSPLPNDITARIAPDRLAARRLAEPAASADG